MSTIELFDEHIEWNARVDEIIHDMEKEFFQYIQQVSKLLWENYQLLQQLHLRESQLENMSDYVVTIEGALLPFIKWFHSIQQMETPLWQSAKSSLAAVIEHSDPNMVPTYEHLRGIWQAMKSPMKSPLNLTNTGLNTTGDMKSPQGEEIVENHMDDQIKDLIGKQIRASIDERNLRIEIAKQMQQADASILIDMDQFHMLRRIADDHPQFYWVGADHDRDHIIRCLVDDQYVQLVGIYRRRLDSMLCGQYYIYLTDKGWTVLDYYRQVSQSMGIHWMDDTPLNRAEADQRFELDIMMKPVVDAFKNTDDLYESGYDAYEDELGIVINWSQTNREGRHTMDRKRNSGTPAGDPNNDMKENDQ